MHSSCMTTRVNPVQAGGRITHAQTVYVLDRIRRIDSVREFSYMPGHTYVRGSVHEHVMFSLDRIRSDEHSPLSSDRIRLAQLCGRASQAERSDALFTDGCYASHIYVCQWDGSDLTINTCVRQVGSVPAVSCYLSCVLRR